MTLLENINKFWILPLEEKLLLCYSLFINVLIKSIIRFLPLKFYYFLISRNREFSSPINIDTLNLRIFTIEKTFARLLKYGLISNNCLEKSLTLKLILNTYGISNRVKIAVSFAENSNLKAHSYIETIGNRTFFKDKRFIDAFNL